MIVGTTTPATPIVAAVPRKLRLEILDFFMMVRLILIRYIVNNYFGFLVIVNIYNK
jgi:hypothetical protein